MGECTVFFKRVLQGFKSLPQNDPNPLENKNHFLSTSNHKLLLSAFMVDFRKLLSTYVFVAFSK